VLVRWWWAALAIAAALLLAPSLLLGVLPSQSSPQNLTWATQFSEQFRAGILYPRWMPDSFEGLGSPAFYFYPPLPFWLDSLVSLCTFNAVSTSHRLSLDWLILLWASGLAMRAWLAAETDRPSISLCGALAYMAAPYHLFVDHYMRGAFAESTAYVFLPLVMLGIRRATDRRPGVVLLALSYAGLLMSHLPTALLVSVTLLPAYAAFRARGLLRLLGPIAGGCLGVGLAAIYLLPAMQLQEWISADQFWIRFYRVDNWFLITPSRWPEAMIMQTIASLALAALVLAAAICVFGWKLAEARFWAIASLVCLALLAGAVPWFWQLPEIAKVQFPWRLMLAVDFALITAFCLLPLRHLARAEVYAYAASAVLVVPGVSFGVAAAAAAVDLTLRHEVVQAQDVKEYEPRGFPIASDLTYSELGLGLSAQVPLVACAPPSELCRGTAERFGEMQIDIQGSAPIEVTVRRFYFPAWTIDGPIAVTPTEKYRLVSFIAPAGYVRVHLRRAALPVEHWGWAISGITLLLLGAASAITARNSYRAGS
jgi:hypothetical protein